MIINSFDEIAIMKKLSRIINENLIKKNKIKFQKKKFKNKTIDKNKEHEKSSNVNKIIELKMFKQMKQKIKRKKQKKRKKQRRKFLKKYFERFISVNLNFFSFEYDLTFTFFIQISNISKVFILKIELTKNNSIKYEKIDDEMIAYVD